MEADECVRDKNVPIQPSRFVAIRLLVREDDSPST